MKKFMFAAVVAFFSSIATLGIVAALTPQAPAGNAPTAVRQISHTELARHNAADDCWLAINGKVYDVTDYIPEHPAAPEVITDWCGKEATEPFDTKGYGRPHSQRAQAMLPKYRVGELKDD